MRAHLIKPVVDIEGNLQSGEAVLVRVLQPGTEEDLDATLYSADSGVDFHPNPISVANGVIDFYLSVPTRVRLGVTIGEAPEQFHEDVDVLMPGPPDTVPSTLYLLSPDSTVWAITIDNDGILHTDDGIVES